MTAPDCSQFAGRSEHPCGTEAQKPVDISIMVHWKFNNIVVTCQLRYRNDKLTCPIILLLKMTQRHPKTCCFSFIFQWYSSPLVVFSSFVFRPICLLLISWPVCLYLVYLVLKIFFFTRFYSKYTGHLGRQVREFLLVFVYFAIFFDMYYNLCIALALVKWVKISF